MTRVEQFDVIQAGIRPTSAGCRRAQIPALVSGGQITPGTTVAALEAAEVPSRGDLPAARGEASARLPVIAWGAIGTAATVAYQSGILADREAVFDTLSRLGEPAAQPPKRPADHSDVQRGQRRVPGRRWRANPSPG